MRLDLFLLAVASATAAHASGLEAQQPEAQPISEIELWWPGMHSGRQKLCA